MAKKIEIFCTLGPKTLNKSFLKNIKGKVNLVRLNLSHISLANLQKNIKFIRKYTPVPICIDTEGAQIRTKVKKKTFFKKGKVGFISSRKNFFLYPAYVSSKLKKNDLLDVGFDNLKIKILSKHESHLKFKTITGGFLENNKGVHLINRKINLHFLTEKDKKAVELGVKMKIKNYALSFTNSESDIIKFEKFIPRYNKIYKLETRNALSNLNKILNKGKNFLIDRGDLSKEIGIENIPMAQRLILKKAKKIKNRKIYIATNYLESMIKNSYPTRGEANDIYSALEMGASGLVLAAETAIGDYPVECIDFLKKMIVVYKSKNKNIRFNKSKNKNIRFNNLNNIQKIKS